MENELHPKSIIENTKMGIGLENIRSRYKYLSNKEVLVNTDDHNFIVQLPILQEG